MKQIHECDYIAVDKGSAINSYGEKFIIGQLVGHQDEDAGFARITGFEFDEVQADVIVLTDKGHSCLPFIETVPVFDINMGDVYTKDDIPEPHRTLLMACRRQGSCDEAVEEAKPFFRVSPETDEYFKMHRYLESFGAWDDVGHDYHTDMGRLLWVMAGELAERGEWCAG